MDRYLDMYSSIPSYKLLTEVCILTNVVQIYFISSLLNCKLMQDQGLLDAHQQTTVCGRNTNESERK